MAIYFRISLPHATQAVVRKGWVDRVGAGSGEARCPSYPEFLPDVLPGKSVQHKKICRTFTDSMPVPPSGLVDPLARFYKTSEAAAQLKVIKTSTDPWKPSPLLFHPRPNAYAAISRFGT